MNFNAKRPIKDEIEKKIGYEYNNENEVEKLSMDKHKHFTLLIVWVRVTLISKFSRNSPNF